MSDLILGGDIGGTKTNIGLFEVAGGPPRLVRTASFHSADYSGLSPIVAEFLAPDAGREVKAGCFGIAGPVLENSVTTPNLAWHIDGDRVAAEVKVPRVLLINDLVATAEGIPLLAEGETALLQAGAAEAPAHEGNRVLVAAGTGLGMALLPRIGDAWVPVPSEGGHADFAPRNEDEIGLLRHLRERYGRVSIERVLSGPGLDNIYTFLRDIRHAAESPEVRAALARGDDPARVIGEHGLGGPGGPGSCALCSKALEMFAAVYGAVAGNLALTGTATGGVWLGGGIAPKILPRLTDGLFLQTFLAKGRFVPFLERLPVRVILNQRAAMLGAARRAASLL
jgi:glucokinase